MENLTTDEQSGSIPDNLDLGDIPTFEWVVRTHSQSLLQRAYRLTHDRFTAEDLSQEVFTQLWDKRHEITIGNSLEGYLQQMLKNRFFRMVSRNKLNEQALEHLLRRMNTLEHSVVDALSADELNQTIANVLDTVPENMKKIFILRDQDLSLREIADALELSEHTVKQYHATLNRKIKKAIMIHHPDLTFSMAAVIASHLTQY